MTDTDQNTTPKGSKRLVLKITALALASFVALGFVAFTSMENYNGYGVLLENQKHLGETDSKIVKAAQDISQLEIYFANPMTLQTFPVVETALVKTQNNFMVLKTIDTPLATRAMNSFLEAKKQSKILKVLLIKREASQRTAPSNVAKLTWLTDQVREQENRIQREITSLKAIFQGIEKEFAQRIVEGEEELAAYENESLTNLYRVLGALALGIFLIHAVVAYLIAKPLAHLTQRMRDMNDGKMPDTIQGTDRNDEFGDIARMLQTFRENAMKIEKMQKHLQDTIAETKKSSQVQNQFMNRMGHELRTPLNAIIGYSEMVVDSVGEKMDMQQLRKDITQIASAGQNLLTMVDAVLELTEEGDGVITPESFNVREEVQQILPNLEVVILKNRNKFKVHCPDASLMMDSDPKKVSKILNNLITNAANFTKNGQIILDITAGNLGDMAAICFKVKDTGGGIEASKVPGLFKAFEHVGMSATRSQNGAGLGLAIVKKLCDALHGQVSVESTVNVGTTFLVIVPCNYDQAHERAEKIALSPLMDAV